MGTRRAWSAEQLAIFHWFEAAVGADRHNLCVEARAGTGKSTTVVEGCLRSPEAKTGRVFITCFNVDAAADVRDKLAKARASNRVEAGTTHSLGFRYLCRAWGRQEVHNGKEGKPDRDRDNAEKAAKTMAGNRSLGEVGLTEVTGLVKKLASLGKNCRPFATVQDLAELAEEFQVFPDDEQEESGWTVGLLAEAARWAMDLAMQKTGAVSHDDQIFLPVVHRMVRGQFDLVVIDEAQDMNRTQLLLAQRACLKGGRICVVGDRYQAIYGFRGADSNSMDQLREEYDATVLGLTTTYRCARSIVAVAQERVPSYQAADDAPEGEVLSKNAKYLFENAGPGDFVLSRTNAPLMTACLRLLALGTRARIAGKDVGASLRSVAKKVGGKTIPEFVARLEQWAERQSAKAAALKSPEAAVQRVADQEACLLALADECESPAEVLGRLDTLFSDEVGAEGYVTCSTVHKAKGLEADRCFLIQDTFGKRPTEEEQNITYVAVTRARKTLVWVDTLTGQKRRRQEPA